jgi:hypothetical protein
MIQITKEDAVLIQAALTSRSKELDRMFVDELKTNGRNRIEYLTSLQQLYEKNKDLTQQLHKRINNQ